MSDLTPEQAARSRQFTEGYKAGQSDARGGYSRNWPRCPEEWKRGYRLGFAWGLDHPSGPALLPEGTRS
jgi:hypothetical protein